MNDALHVFAEHLGQMVVWKIAQQLLHSLLYRLWLTCARALHVMRALVQLPTLLLLEQLQSSWCKGDQKHYSPGP